MRFGMHNRRRQIPQRLMWPNLVVKFQIGRKSLARLTWRSVIGEIHFSCLTLRQSRSVKLSIRFFDAKPQPIYRDWRQPLPYLTLSQQKETAKQQDRTQDGVFGTSIENEQGYNKSNQMAMA